jgi:hypothetical protein
MYLCYGKGEEGGHKYIYVMERGRRADKNKTRHLE